MICLETVCDGAFLGAVRRFEKIGNIFFHIFPMRPEKLKLKSSAKTSTGSIMLSAHLTPTARAVAEGKNPGASLLQPVRRGACAAIN